MVKIGVWWWYDTGAPPPSLAVAKGSAHTRYSVLLCWWRRWSCWWCRLVVPLPRHRLTIIEGWSSLRDPQICSQTHPLESIILTVLVLQVIDLGLEVLDFLMKLEDGLPNVLDVQLVVVGELCDHNVIGIESTLHHLLTLENLLLQCLEPCLRASLVPQHRGCATTPHASQWFEGVAALLQGRGWWPSWRTSPWGHLKMTWRPGFVRKTAQNKNRRFLRDTGVKTPGRLYNEFLPTKIGVVYKNGVRRAHEVGGVPSTLMEPLCPSRTASYFSIFLNIPKRKKIAIRTVLESVYLPYHVPIPFRSLKCSEKCPLCIPPGLRFQ